MTGRWHRPLSVRFWEKVDQSGGPDACWTWQAHCNLDGYGIAWDGQAQTRAHRVAWTLTNGPIPVDFHVLHHCDNPPCVNPAHLWLGTNAANVADREAKGRNVVRAGEDHHAAKLTWADVEEIRRLYRPRHGVGALAARFGVSRDTITLAATGRTWRTPDAAR